MSMLEMPIQIRPTSTASNQEGRLKCSLTDVCADKMLPDAQTAGLVKLHCGKGFSFERQEWAVRDRRQEGRESVLRCKGVIPSSYQVKGNFEWVSNPTLPRHSRKRTSLNSFSSSTTEKSCSPVCAAERSKTRRRAILADHFKAARLRARFGERSSDAR